MKGIRRFWTFSAGGLVVAAAFAASIGLAYAQTTGPGPYYATPSWDQKITASSRFLLLSNWSGQAVLDKETGLVWERSPGTTLKSWHEARAYCTQLTKGNRRGWRLPRLQELTSLLSPSIAPPGPQLPTGHPFRNVQSYFYWSATQHEANSLSAWAGSFSGAADGPGPKTNEFFVWCVRGGGLDAQ